jgi:microcystin-dependent protein
MTSYCRSFLTFGAHQKPTVGDTKTSVISNDHMGWLLCDGRSVAISDFEFLFNVIGYSFGGSGDNFNLPNPAGRIPGIVGTGRDSNATFSTLTLALGSTIGEYNHTLTIAEMPTHNHGVTDPGHSHALTTVNDDYNNNSGYPNNTRISAPQYDSGNVTLWTSSVSSTTTGISINNTGGSNQHNNIQPMIGMGNMFIYCGRPTYPLVGYPYTEGTIIY